MNVNDPSPLIFTVLPINVVTSDVPGISGVSSKSTTVVDGPSSFASTPLAAATRYVNPDVE